MIRKTIAIALAGSLAFAFAGCAGSTSTVTPSTTTSTVTGTTATTIASELQEVANEVNVAVVSTCSFVPTAETITDIVATFEPQIAAGSAVGQTIANKICAAATAKSSRLAERLPTVNGVVVEGTFVTPSKAAVLLSKLRARHAR